MTSRHPANASQRCAAMNVEGAMVEAVALPAARFPVSTSTLRVCPGVSEIGTVHNRVRSSCSTSRTPVVISPVGPSFWRCTASPSITVS